jgi:hypothetical protein
MQLSFSCITEFKMKDIELDFIRLSHGLCSFPSTDGQRGKRNHNHTTKEHLHRLTFVVASRRISPTWKTTTAVLPSVAAMKASLTKQSYGFSET